MSERGAYYPPGRARCRAWLSIAQVAAGTYKAVRVDDDGLMIEGIDTDANL